MIIIWRGAGALVILFAIVAALLTKVVTSAVFNVNNYFAIHSWAQALSLWITGAACWCVGKHLHGKPGKTVIDQATGRELTLKPRHDLMFIKMEYWAPIFFVVGMVVMMRGAIGH
jgi:hypothetical protein